MQKSHTALDRCVDWERIATAFYTTNRSFRSIAADAGVSHTAIAKHAKRHGWCRPSRGGPRALETGVSLLARAAEAQLAKIDGVQERSRRFIAAMIQLGAKSGNIAEVLGVSEEALRSEFPKELAGAR
jgi:hypothetical protein